MVKLSEDGGRRADIARRKAGFNNKYQIGEITEGVLKHFWGEKKDISVSKFKEICQEIGIQDWTSVVDWEDYIAQWRNARLKYKLPDHHAQGVGTLAVKTIKDNIKDNIILASGSYDSTINIWQINKDQTTHLKTLNGHKSDVAALIYSKDKDKLISASYDRTIKFWDTTSWECLDTLENAHQGRIECIALTSEGQYLLVSSCDSASIWVWDVREKRAIRTLEEHSHGDLECINRHNSPMKSNAVLGLLAHENTIISGGMDGKVMLWELSKNQEEVLEEPTIINKELFLKPITSLTLSPNGKILVVGENSYQITVWDIPTRTMIYDSTQKHNYPNTLSLAYHPTGTIISSASFDLHPHDDTKAIPNIRLWNPHNGDIITTLRGHLHPVRSLIFTPDGKSLISGDEGGHIFLWGIE